MNRISVAILSVVCTCTANWGFGQQDTFRPRSGVPSTQSNTARQTSTVRQASASRQAGVAQQNGLVRQAAAIRPNQPSQKSSVSQDLLNVYSQTQRATSEQDVTRIARKCSEIVSEPSRSTIDRDYASSLLSWALNRRGEMRSDRAAKLVERNRLDEADAIDKQAADDFETAIKYGPSNWRTHHNFAIALAMRGEYQRGIKEFTESIGLKQDYPNAYFNRAELYFETEKFARAMVDYSKAIELEPSDAQYYNSRAHCAFEMQQFDDAIADYENAAQLSPDDVVYRTDLADALQFTGDWEAAASVYRSAIGIDSEYPRAYQNAAWLMATCPDSKIRNSQLAVSAAQRAMELAESRTARGYDTLAAANAAAGRYSEAVRMQREALKLATDSAEKEDLVRRLKLFEQKRAYRQKPASQLVTGRIAQEDANEQRSIR